MSGRDTIATLRRAARQEQFLDILTRDEAEQRFRAHLRLEPIGEETVPLAKANGRVLAADVLAPVDVPGFDRASVDGFAVRAEDTVGATEQEPRLLRLNPEMLTPGTEPRHAVLPGTATLIATGGMVPRGADAVIMVEQTDVREIPIIGESGSDMLVEIRSPTVPGQFIACIGFGHRARRDGAAAWSHLDLAGNRHARRGRTGAGSGLAPASRGDLFHRG